MSGIEAIVETAISVDDRDAAEAFSRDVLGLEVIGKEAGRHVYFRAGDGVLLAFDPEATLWGDVFPSHGPRGRSGPGRIRRAGDEGRPANGPHVTISELA